MIKPNVTESQWFTHTESCTCDCRCFSSNPVTLPTNMEHLQSLPPPHLSSPRLARLGHQLEPLLPARQGDNKRKRLNAVLDKLTSNINKVSEDASGGEPEPDSPDKNLEIEFNVKTKFKKEESEDTSGEQQIVNYWIISVAINTQTSSLYMPNIKASQTFGFLF